MIRFIFITLSFLLANVSFSQHVGIVRKNYYSYYFDTLLNQNIEVFDSSTVRLGTIDPLTGIVTHQGASEYNTPINLNGATLNPYTNQYYIGSGFNLLTFDINSGNLMNNAPISGPLPSASFQNYRFNPSDSIVYGMVPSNFYSTYFDSISMTEIEVLDSTQIRFGSIDPETGDYNIIGNTSFNNLYTLAGNSIDPFQMVYYYSAVDTLIGIDLYDGSIFSEVAIQLPLHGIFENIAYSCADTSIYGLTRQNYTSIVFDSLFMDYIEIVDSTTFRLSKINPNTGVVTFVSPYNIGAGGNLTGGAFIDPNSMTYFFNNGGEIKGVSLMTGLITSSIGTSFPSGEIAFDMMRSTQNCFGATKMRNNNPLKVTEIQESEVTVFPNPTENELTISSSSPILSIEIVDLTGNQLLIGKEQQLDVSHLPDGLYLVKVLTSEGKAMTRKFLKQ